MRLKMKACMQYTEAWVKLLTQVAKAPRKIFCKVDEYFFGYLDERDEELASIRPYFYGSISFGIFIVCNMYFIVY